MLCLPYEIATIFINLVGNCIVNGRIRLCIRLGCTTIRPLNNYYSSIIKFCLEIICILKASESRNISRIFNTKIKFIIFSAFAEMMRQMANTQASRKRPLLFERICFANIGNHFSILFSVLNSGSQAKAVI